MLLRIDPTAIQHFLKLKTDELEPGVNSKDLTARRYKGKRFTGLILQDCAIQKGRPLQRCPHFRGTLQRVQNGLNWDETEYGTLYNTWYTKMNGGKYQHKSFKDFYEHRLKTWDHIFNDIKTNGYKELKPKRDNIEVAINNSGQILLIDGRHRLAFAQTLELKTVPVVVNILSESLAKAFATTSPRLIKQLQSDSIARRCSVAAKQATPGPSNKR